VFVGFGRRCRAARTDARQAGLAVAAGGTFIAWLVQTSVDWLHLIPGLTGLALCSAAVLAGPWARPEGSTRNRARLVVIPLAAVVVIVGAVFVGRSALADHYRAQGQHALAGDPVYALKKSSESLALNDESLPAYYLRSAAWARLGDYRPARAALLEAVRREPHNFVPWALLGDLARRRGDKSLARAYYRRSARLNPREAALTGAVYPTMAK
jgi:tetratricopeptide (TPR) repeat protein